MFIRARVGYCLCCIVFCFSLQSQTVYRNLQVLSKNVRVSCKIYFFFIGTDLFRLSILFSQYRSGDDSQESVFFGFMLARSLFNEHAKPPRYRHMTCIGKTKSTSERGLLKLDYENFVYI